MFQEVVTVALALQQRISSRRCLNTNKQSIGTPSSREVVGSRVFEPFNGIQMDEGALKAQ